MAFTLTVLVLSIILFINGLAILNEPRFLRPRGWSHENDADLDASSFKRSVIALLSTLRTFGRPPLIIANVACIIFLAIFG